MTGVRRFEWVAVLVVGLQSMLHAQVEVAQQPQEADQTGFFDFDAITFAIPDSPRSRLDIYVQVPYENLSFVKKSDKYYGSYEVTIDVFDSAGTLAGEKVWTEEVYTNTFDESVSSQAHSLAQRSFELVPGRHSIVVTFHDNETKKSNRILKQILVTDYAASIFSLSDIMLVRKLTIAGSKKYILPNVSSNVGNLPGAFYIFFEAYGGKSGDSIRFVATAYNEKNSEQLEIDTVSALERGRTQVFLKIDSAKLTLGDYKLVVRAYPLHPALGQERVSLASTNRLFSIHWRGLPKGVKDLDIAIEQLQYIAKEGEVSDIKDAKTFEEKQKRFLEFWQKRDPNPNTPRNEKMEQYYAKVEYANKHFKHYQEGWRTDMGMVYIIFGAPNNVERHPFDIDAKPYEVWSYYELNHQFVFVDQTGFGDYRLITPIWEVWQRPRE